MTWQTLCFIQSKLKKQLLVRGGLKIQDTAIRKLESYMGYVLYTYVVGHMTEFMDTNTVYETIDMVALHSVFCVSRFKIRDVVGTLLTIRPLPTKVINIVCDFLFKEFLLVLDQCERTMQMYKKIMITDTYMDTILIDRNPVFATLVSIVPKKTNDCLVRHESKNIEVLFTIPDEKKRKQIDEKAPFVHIDIETCTISIDKDGTTKDKMEKEEPNTYNSNKRRPNKKRTTTHVSSKRRSTKKGTTAHSPIEHRPTTHGSRKRRPNKDGSYKEGSTSLFLPLLPFNDGIVEGMDIVEVVPIDTNHGKRRSTRSHVLYNRATRGLDKSFETTELSNQTSESSEDSDSS